MFVGECEVVGAYHVYFLPHHSISLSLARRSGDSCDQKLAARPPIRWRWDARTLSKNIRHAYLTWKVLHTDAVLLCAYKTPLKFNYPDRESLLVVLHALQFRLLKGNVDMSLMNGIITVVPLYPTTPQQLVEQTCFCVTLKASVARLTRPVFHSYHILWKGSCALRHRPRSSWL